MKASRASIGRAVDQPQQQTVFYLFHGPDQGQSRGLGARLAEALKASRVLISTGAIKSDHALISDEACAMNLFGGSRVIWIEPAGEDIVEGVRTLLDLPKTENPVVAIGGSLRKSSGLLKLAEASPAALAYASYLPEGQDAGRMVSDAARRFGLKVAAPVAARIAASCGNDQAVVTQELAKLALYLDASPHSPRELDHDAVDLVGADTAEGNVLRLADLALGGAVSELSDELGRLPAAGSEAIPVVRSLQRRLLMLAPARARVERGERVEDVMASLGKALFWKDKPLIGRMLSTWRADDLAKISERAGKLERDLMFSGAPEREALGEELLAIARRARSLG